MSFHQRRSFRTPGPGVELSRGHPFWRALRELRQTLQVAVLSCVALAAFPAAAQTAPGGSSSAGTSGGSARNAPGALKVGSEEAGGHAVLAALIEQIGRCNEGPTPEAFHRALSRASLIENRPYDINAEQFSYALRTPLTVGHGLKVTHVALLGHENSGYSWVGLTLAMPVAAAEAALKASAWPVRGKTRTRKSTGEILVRERALVPAVNLKGATNWLCGFQGD